MGEIITITGAGKNQSSGTCSSGVATEAWNNVTTGKRNSRIYLDGGDEYVTIAESDIMPLTACVNPWKKVTVNFAPSTGTP